MSLLWAETIEVGKSVAEISRVRRREVFQRARYGAGGAQVPATHRKLEGEEAAAFLDVTRNKATGAERAGRRDDPNLIAMQNPSVQAEMAEHLV